MMQLRICVFCGSSPESSPIYAQEAVSLAGALAEARINLIYGGGGTGLMGEVARTLKSRGGHVTGIVPRALLNGENGEEIFRDLDVLHIVDSYHERKMLMYHLSDGFVTLPGGPGTLEELMEHLTWMHRGQRHSRKPVYIVNQSGYWDPLLRMFESMQKSGFISADLNSRYSIYQSACEAISDFTRSAQCSRRIVAGTKGRAQILSDESEHRINDEQLTWRKDNV
jgi:uncharacterized protein (TIGR00730 family)